jgi:hypothetical protein
MRSGSSAHDDHGWQSGRHPYADEATTGQAPYGTYGQGPRSDPPQGAAGWQQVPFGPEISWPGGFRPLDPQTREILESGYRAVPSYQQPAQDDYGYGDPGYQDPAYDGPRTPYADPGTSAGAAPGYQAPHGYRVPEPPRHAGPGYHQGFTPPSADAHDIYPVTGAQEALPDAGPQSWAGGSPGAGNPGYPEQWYGSPRLNERPPDDAAPGGGPAADPRLAGMRYDELRYEETSYGGPRYDEPLDDESWYEELRRSGPSYPQQGDRERGGRQHGNAAPGGGHRPSAPAAGAGAWDGAGSQTGPRPPAGPAGPAGPPAGGLRGGGAPEASAARQPGTAFPQAQAFSGSGYLDAPTAQINLLTPSGGRRLDGVPGGGAVLAAVNTGLIPAGVGANPTVQPGRGLDGPEITSSWPVRPQSDDLDAFDEFWREDGGYPGLIGDDSNRDDRRGKGKKKAAAVRSTGRRRGRSNDHRLWLALGGVVVVTAAAIAGIIKFEFPSHSGPAHTMVTPTRIGSFVRTVDLERQTDLAQLRAEVIKMSSGQASDVVSAVYESGDSAAGSDAQIIMFIGGHLANAAPAASISSFTQKFPGAAVVSAGSLGGEAACVEDGVGTSSTAAMCAWFDNDSFGEIVSPTMNAADLAKDMRTLRPSVELVDEK